MSILRFFYRYTLTKPSNNTNFSSYSPPPPLFFCLSAEEENRRQRAIANSRLYTDNSGPSGPGGGVNNVPVSSVNRYNAGGVGGGGSNSSRTEQESRSKAYHDRSDMPMQSDELAQKLSDATQGAGRGNRLVTPLVLDAHI